MRLKSEFIKLPLSFDAKRLEKEIAAFDEKDWCPHPQGFPGNHALLLISANGSTTDNNPKGPMLPSPLLEKSPYLKQVLASFGTIFGRTRLMRLDGQSQVSLHTDYNYYWHQRMRIHVPITTHPDVLFLCGDKQVHMKAGESWVFDTWQPHNVINPNNKVRIHLVADTVGSINLQNLLDQSWYPFLKNSPPEQSKLVTFNPNQTSKILTEKINFPVIMTPWEQESLLNPIIADMQNNTDQASQTILQLVQAFTQRWKVIWHSYGDTKNGEPLYKETLDFFRSKLEAIDTKVLLPNKTSAVTGVIHAVFESALNPELREKYADNDNAQNTNIKQQAEIQKKVKINPLTNLPIIDEIPTLAAPLIIISAPRSGSTLLFETLAQSPDLYTIGGESHHIIESIPALTPSANNYDSNRLYANHATPEITNNIRTSFANNLRDRDGNKPISNSSPITMLEKTPKNALRISFLRKIFPQAKFIYLYRNPKENISSIIDAWKSDRFITYKNLPQRKNPWSLLLIPGWEKLDEDDIPTTAASQWQQTHETIMADLKLCNKDKITTVRYEDFIENPQKIIDQLCNFADIKWDKPLEKALPHSIHTLTKPDPNKWIKNKKDLDRVLPTVRETQEKAEKFITEYQ